MKNLSIFMAFFFAIHFCQAQSVGIGTTTPASNSVLDITSTNKGILLPRVNDTSSVASPTAGLMIYNKNTNTPAFHDGTKWQSVAKLASVLSSPSDSIVYTIASATNGLIAGTYKIESISTGVSISGITPISQSITISKLLDKNSIPFKAGVFAGTTFPKIEFFFYTSGSANPYFSIKLTTYRASSQQFGTSTNSIFSEQYAFDAQIIGYKDWVNNTSSAWNFSTNASVAY